MGIIGNMLEQQLKRVSDETLLLLVANRLRTSKRSLTALMNVTDALMHLYTNSPKRRATLADMEMLEEFRIACYRP